MKLHFCALALIFGAPLSSAASPFLTDLPWVPKELPRLIISTYPDSLTTANYTWLKEKGGLFRAIFSQRADFGGSDFCESLLEASQLFSLNKMVERKNYISPTQKAELLKIANKLKPSQFRFFELIHVANGKDLENRDVDPKKGDLPMTLIPFFNDKVGLIEATMWTVAAQSTSSHVRKQNERLPWQLDTEFSSVKFDREEYPYAWEIGRAAHNKGVDMDILLRGATLGILNDLLASGAEPKDGCVFMHALGPVQARLFKARKNPKTGEPVFRIFATHGEPGHNEVLRASVSDLLDTFSPGDFSQSIAGLKQISGGRLSDVAAMELIYTTRDHLRQDLDVVSPNIPDRSHPIVLENTTPTAGWFMAKVAARHGVYDVGPNISQFLSGLTWQDQERRDFRRVDPQVPGMTELAKFKAIGLSNFSDEAAKSYPQYVKLILLGAYLHWEKSLTREYPREAGRLLDMTRFFVMSSHDSVIQQANAVPGAIAVSMPSTKVHGRMQSSGDAAFTFQPKYEFTVGPAFAFDRAAILALIKANPQLAREAAKVLRKGNAQIQSMSMDANAF